MSFPVFPGRQTLKYICLVLSTIFFLLPQLYAAAVDLKQHMAQVIPESVPAPKAEKMHEAFEIGNQVATLMAELASAYV
jgi:hypothetical protein